MEIRDVSKVTMLRPRRLLTMLNNAAEAIETISACARIIEHHADTTPELWAVVAALRSCEDWVLAQGDLIQK